MTKKLITAVSFEYKMIHLKFNSLVNYFIKRWHYLITEFIDLDKLGAGEIYNFIKLIIKLIIESLH